MFSINHKKSKFVAGLVFLFLIMPISLVADSAKKNSSQKESTVKIQNTAIGFIEALANKEGPKGLLINLEATRDYDNHRPVTVSVDADNDTDDSLKRMLNEISEQSDYTWIQHGKVINVFPRETIGNKDYLLNADIDEIDVNGTGIQTVMDAITKKLNQEYPGKFEVTYQGQKKNLLSYSVITNYPNNQQPGIMQTDTTDFSIHLHHATVREILNVVAKEETYWGIFYVNTPGFIHQQLVFTF